MKKTKWSVRVNIDMRCKDIVMREQSKALAKGERIPQDKIIEKIILSHASKN